VEILDVMSGDEEKPLTLEDFQALGEDLLDTTLVCVFTSGVSGLLPSVSVDSGYGYVYGRDGKTYRRLPGGSEIEVDSLANP